MYSLCLSVVLRGQCFRAPHEGSNMGQFSLATAKDPTEQVTALVSVLTYVIAPLIEQWRVSVVVDLHKPRRVCMVERPSVSFLQFSRKSAIRLHHWREDHV